MRGCRAAAVESGELPHPTITASRSPNPNMHRNHFTPAKLLKIHQTQSKIYLQAAILNHSGNHLNKF
jgi:hypothetical protein